MLKQFLEVGRITGTHGVRGEVRVEPWANDAQFLCQFSRMYFHGGQEEIEIASARTHKSAALLKIRGVDDIPSAQRLRGRILFIRRADVTLGEDEYFFQDLIGLKVVDADSGVSYGVISDVSRTGANDVYHLNTPSGEVLIPAIPEIVRRIDVEEGVMEILPMKGLFDDED